MSSKKEPIEVEWGFLEWKSNSLKLQEQFEAESGSAAWINADVYPDGKIYTQEYVRWLERKNTPQPSAAPLTKGSAVAATTGKEPQADTWITCPTCDGFEEVFVENSFDGGDIVPCMRCHNGKVRKPEHLAELIPDKVIWGAAAIAIGCVVALLFKLGILG